MTKSISLNGEWDLAWAEGYPLLPPTSAMAESKGTKAFIKAKVPAPVHRVLMDAGIIEDPNIGLNSLKCRWVEEMFWIYRREFEAPADAPGKPVRLVFKILELDAEVFLNGVKVGTHANAHREARFDVTGKLKPGKNLLVVKLSAGMHSASDKPGNGYHAGDTALLTKRHWHRHSQCQGGWDWQARLLNVGILGDVELSWGLAPFLEEPTAFALLSPDLANAEMRIGATLVSFGDAPAQGVFTATIRETGQTAEKSVSTEKGETRHVLSIAMSKPELWWPRGHGRQALYHVDLQWISLGEAQTAVLTAGVRKIEIDQTPHPEGGRYCVIKVNNRPIFAKGGNWVPASMLYSEVSAERYREFVRLALDANFNTLRIWGGGIFAGQALLDACDEAGIMVWHDFLFACAQYPLHDPDFLAETKREITHAVRTMANHPSLLVWCGNNEIEWSDWGFYSASNPARPHYALFHLDIPRILKAEDPSKAYWPSSPWSPDFLPPNDPSAGDQHPWSVSLLEPGGADWLEYRKMSDRLPNEGGVLGMSGPATIRQFLPKGERSLMSLAWEHHDNPFAVMDCKPGVMGHAYQTVRLWTGKDPLAMDWEDYAFASALLQGEGLSEYISNFRRRMFSSASAIFWMYNDCWPTTHGWTIVDFYRRKKLAYHPVRRAFQPVAVVAAADEKNVEIHGVNDTPEEWRGELRFGIFSLSGGMPPDRTEPVVLGPNSSTVLARFSRSEWDALGLRDHGVFAFLLKAGRIASWHRLFLERFKDLRFAKPSIGIIEKDGEAVFESDVYAWGVCVDIDGEAPVADNCFDLFPGVPYHIPWDAAGLGKPSILRIGSVDAIGTDINSHDSGKDL